MPAGRPRTRPEKVAIELDADYKVARTQWLEVKPGLQGFEQSWRAQHGVDRHGSAESHDLDKTVTSFSLIKVKGGYQVATITSIGHKISDIEYTETEFKNFALERLIYKLELEIQKEE